MLKIEILSGDFTVCKLSDLPKSLSKEYFCFLSVTDNEISLVCPADFVPDTAIVSEHGWKGFRVAGKLDFSLVGILAEIASLLAAEKISIFAVSTYDTDYIFTKSRVFDKAIKTLENNGYLIQNTEI